MSEQGVEGTRFAMSYFCGHMVAAIDGGLWVLDTGSPASFGRQPMLRIAGDSIPVASAYMGLDADTLSRLIGGEVAGLVGTDVLNRFDVVFDARPECMQLHCHAEELELAGKVLPLDSVLGVPLVQVRIDGELHSMFFDTGASISYFQGDGLDQHPSLGVVSDFYPGVGSFQTGTWRLPVQVGEQALSLRAGQLPGLLGMTLALAGAAGIVGNELCAGRRVGYFARRARLVLA